MEPILSINLMGDRLRDVVGREKSLAFGSVYFFPVSIRPNRPLRRLGGPVPSLWKQRYSDCFFAICCSAVFFFVIFSMVFATNEIPQ